jgi:hypothetical protein
MNANTISLPYQGKANKLGYTATHQGLSNNITIECEKNHRGLGDLNSDKQNKQISMCQTKQTNYLPW